MKPSIDSIYGAIVHQSVRQAEIQAAELLAELDPYDGPPTEPDFAPSEYSGPPTIRDVCTTTMPARAA